MTNQPGWHRIDIIAAIHKRGMSLVRLSTLHDYAESTLRAALQKPHTRANRIIAEFIGVPMHELWPAWFDLSGRLIAPSDPAQPSHPRTSQKRRRA